MINEYQDQDVWFELDRFDDVVGWVPVGDFDTHPEAEAERSTMTEKTRIRRVYGIG